MPPSELRKEARASLSGKWGKAIGIILAYLLINFAIGFVEGLFQGNSFLYLLIEIAVLIITVPLSFGLLISFMKLKRGEDVNAFGFISEGFSKFGKSWGIAWHTFVRMLLPIICMILVIMLLAFSIGFGVASGNYILTLAITVLYIGTIIYTACRGFLYVLAYFIGYDNQEMSSRDCVLKSEALMKGNRGNYFLLQLSFIGWGILACFTLGIGMLWLMPYIVVAEVCFHDRITKVSEPKIEEAEKIEE